MSSRSGSRVNIQPPMANGSRSGSKKGSQTERAMAARRPKRDYVADYISGGITAQGASQSTGSKAGTTSGTGLSYDARESGPLGPRMSQLTKTPSRRTRAGGDENGQVAAANTPRGHLNGIDLALEENRPHDALALAKKLMVQLSNLDMADKERMLMELQGRVARTHLSLGDPGKAVDAYRKQLSIASKHGLAPECSALYGELGRLHMSIGQHSQAVPYWERKLKMATGGAEKTEIQSQLAKCHLELGDTAKAMRYGEMLTA